nr:MAG TPA: hypothetical protein [Caudoviricetes sp.]
MHTYTVKERFEETVQGVRTYTVNASSVEEAWALVEGGDVAPDSEQSDTELSHHERISAFIISI